MGIYNGHAAQNDHMFKEFKLEVSCTVHYVAVRLQCWDRYA